MGIRTRAESEYKLTVDGLVDRPMTLSYSELLRLPATKLVDDFQCVTGWRVPSVHWQGVLLSTLLDEAGRCSLPGKALHFESFDGVYTESLTLAEARRPDVIVAYNMLGGPISQEHGGPVRLYVAPMYGYKSIKWLSRVEGRGSSRARLLGDGRPLLDRGVGRTKQWPQRPGHLAAAGPRPDSRGGRLPAQSSILWNAWFTGSPPSSSVHSS